MTDSAASAPKPYVRPALNRPQVSQRVQGTPLLDWDAFGRYRFALKHFRFEPGKKNNPHYHADVKIVASEPVIFEGKSYETHKPWGPGRIIGLHFPTGRAGTATNPGRPDFDDAYLAGFIRAVFRIARGQQFDCEAGLDELIEKGKIDSDALVFSFTRTPDPKPQEIKDPTNGEVLRTVTRVWTKDAFEPVVAA